MSGYLNVRLWWMLFAVFSALSVGTASRLIALRGAEDDVVKSRIGSLKVWWTLAVLLSIALLLAPVGVIILFALASGLGLNEYRRFVVTGEPDRFALVIAFVCIPINYALIWMGWIEAFVVFIPLASLLMLAAWRSTSGRVNDYIRTTGGLFWGLMIIVHGLSYAVALFTLPEAGNPGFGNIGWFLFLVILTEMNDIAQALIGRRIGKHRITPRVSPNKSWEGFVGGMVITILLAAAMAPFLTPFANRELLEAWDVPLPVPYVWAIVAGMIIALTGFLGDINMSAIKRDVGVKDGSRLLPGQGGVIDRIDSLTFTGPVFYYFVVWLIS